MGTMPLVFLGHQCNFSLSLTDCVCACLWERERKKGECMHTWVQSTRNVLTCMWLDVFQFGKAWIHLSPAKVHKNITAFGTLPCKFKMGQSAMLGLSDLIKGCKISKLGRSFPEKIGSYFLRNSSISKDIFELEIDLSGFCLNMRWEKFYINEVP